MKRLIGLLILLLLSVLACACAADTAQPSDSTAADPPPVTSPLRIYCLKLGDADCTLLCTDTELIVIDCGESKHADRIAQAVSLLGFDAIDLLILSHPDKDHIGAASALVERGLVGKILQSSYDKGSDTQARLKRAAAEAEVEMTDVKEITVLPLSGLRITLYPTLQTYREEDASNEHSLGTLVEHGRVRLFFAGDGVGQRLVEMREQLRGVGEVDLMKIPHHGRYDNHSDLLIDALSPAHAIICAAASSPPDPRILTLLNRAGADHHLTAHGTVFMESDGNRLHVEE